MVSEISDWILSEMGISLWELKSPSTPKNLDLTIVNLNTDWIVFLEFYDHKDLLISILKAAKAKSVSYNIQSKWSPFSTECELHNSKFMPSIVLVMGEYPAQILLHTFQFIDKLRERTHSLSFYTCPVIVTYSLEQIHTSKEYKRKAWQDIQMGMRLCQ